jgi:hypothetical protein
MYATSFVHEAIETQKRLPAWAHVVLDEAFGCTDQELVAWSSGKNALSQEKDAFNYYLSSQRQSVERVFGVMNNRFGILWRQMSFDFDRYKLILVALCRFDYFIIIMFVINHAVIDRLHNFINMDRELAKLNKRHEMCHEEDTLWKRGLTREGNMPDDLEMLMVSHEMDLNAPVVRTRPGAGSRSDLLSDRRVAITAEMKTYNCKRPKGSKQAQEIRYRRALANLTCA